MIASVETQFYFVAVLYYCLHPGLYICSKKIDHELRHADNEGYVLESDFNLTYPSGSGAEYQATNSTDLYSSDRRDIFSALQPQFFTANW